MEYIKLAGAAVLPVFVSVVFFLLDRNTPFGKINGKIKQVIYGIVFGGLAILGTEAGIPIGGAQINCRDAAVLIAGLMFGSPAGLIAGTIGAAERWFAVLWGVGSFTRVACTLSTFAAGVYAACLRKYMFENKKPGWFMSFTLGVVIEVFHMTMVFVTNMADAAKAFDTVKTASLPMILSNGLSVMLASVFLSVLLREKIVPHHEKVNISQTVQRWLLITVTLAFGVTSYFVFSLQNKIAEEQTASTLETSLSEVAADIKNSAKYGAELDERIYDMALNRTVGKTGYIVILDSELRIVSLPSVYSADGSLIGSDFPGTEDEKTVFRNALGGEEKIYGPSEGLIEDEQCFISFMPSDGYIIAAVLPEKEAYEARNVAFCVNVFMEILVFAVLFIQIYMLIKRVVVNQIKSINSSLAKITGGDLNETVDVRTNAEFASLSDDINKTVEVLKKYIDEASARINSELEFARTIQSSALPNVFPAFPRRKDFDIYACMDAAKEVGGDFYDFYITESDMLNFLIADVSGKGIPAAMFMMRAKTEIKSLTENGLAVNDVFTRSNADLCEGNDAGMFVTAWQAGLDLTNGKVRFANAGHNPPLIKRNGGEFEYFKSRPGFVLAGFDDFEYTAQEFSISPGDIIFLYTDGVTEAVNTNKELFGEKRLLETVNAAPSDDMKKFCEYVRQRVDVFADGAEQFDDITMLAVKYTGAPTISFPAASIKDITEVTEFAERELEKIGCPLKTVYQINVVIDEIYSNIVRYGYPDCTGPVSVQIIERNSPHSVYIRFADEGIPYNPLTNEDPDVSLPLEERGGGGLGIFIVKKTMDDIKYKYENGQNILTVKKLLE